MTAEPQGPYDTAEQIHDAPMAREAAALHNSGRVRSGDPDRLVRDTFARHLFNACRAAGVELGTLDRQTLNWLCGWDIDTIQSLIGIITRANRPAPPASPAPPPSTVDTAALDLAMAVLQRHNAAPTGWGGEGDALRAALAEVVAEVGPVYVEAAIAWAMDELRRDAVDPTTRTALDRVRAQAGTATRLIDPVAALADHITSCTLAASMCPRCDGSATRWDRVAAVRQLISPRGDAQALPVDEARLMLGIDVMMCVPCLPQRVPAIRSVHHPTMGSEPMCAVHAVEQERRNIR